MRVIPLLLIAAAVVGCTTSPQPPTRTVQAQAKLDKLIAGKVAGSPVSCLPYRPRGEMVTIDDQTVVFRDGPGGRVYVNTLLGECNGLESGWYALVTRSGGTGLCRGDISTVSDIRNGTTVGACAIGDFVPYTPARG